MPIPVDAQWASENLSDYFCFKCLHVDFKSSNLQLLSELLSVKHPKFL